MTNPLRSSPGMLGMLLTLAMVACDQETMAPEAAAGSLDISASMLTGSPEASAWLAELRAATSSFHQVDAAVAAGWDTPITACRENPSVGGMGYHYGNLPLLFDGGDVDELAPETLLYAPEKNGRLRLVGVEYIVLFSDVPPDAEAPSLHGVHFHPNTSDGVWALHAWIWQDNPNGVFEDWNPKVSCEYAE